MNADAWLNLRTFKIGSAIFGVDRSVDRDGWTFNGRRLPFVWVGMLDEDGIRAIRVVIGDRVFGVYWFNDKG